MRKERKYRGRRLLWDAKRDSVGNGDFWAEQLKMGIMRQNLKRTYENYGRKAAIRYGEGTQGFQKNVFDDWSVF